MAESHSAAGDGRALEGPVGGLLAEAVHCHKQFLALQLVAAHQTVEAGAAAGADELDQHGEDFLADVGHVLERLQGVSVAHLDLAVWRGHTAEIVSEISSLCPMRAAEA